MTAAASPFGYIICRLSAAEQDLMVMSEISVGLVDDCCSWDGYQNPDVAAITTGQLENVETREKV
jgi:hypothetical protein